jgi:hypothetical protein
VGAVGGPRPLFLPPPFFRSGQATVYGGAVLVDLEVLGSDYSSARSNQDVLNG